MLILKSLPLNVQGLYALPEIVTKSWGRGLNSYFGRVGNREITSPNLHCGDNLMPWYFGRNGGPDIFHFI